MSDSTCASCGAPHRGGAWCPICYAPVPGVEQAVAVAEDDSAGHRTTQDVAHAELGRHSAEGAAEERAVAALVDAGAVALATVATRSAEHRHGRHRIVQTWPCTRCGAQTPIEEDACADCGASFLADVAAAGPVVDIPVLSGLSTRSTPVRIAAALGLAALVVVVVVGALLLLDLLF